MPTPSPPSTAWPSSSRQHYRLHPLASDSPTSRRARHLAPGSALPGSALRCRIEPYLDQAAPLRRRRARRRRQAQPRKARPAHAGPHPVTPQISPAHPVRRSGCGCRLPGAPLSRSRIPRLGRHASVASRWLRQPRPGTHSRGIGAYQEDGIGLKPVGWCEPSPIGPALAAGQSWP